MNIFPSPPSHPPLKYGFFPSHFLYSFFFLPNSNNMRYPPTLEIAKWKYKRRKYIQYTHTQKKIFFYKSLADYANKMLDTILQVRRERKEKETGEEIMGDRRHLNTCGDVNNGGGDTWMTCQNHHNCNVNIVYIYVGMLCEIQKIDVESYLP